MSDSRPIGIFDSGMGGLTVVKEMLRLLPAEQLVYFGDTARVPYGPKSVDTIIRFSIENILFLLKHRVKMVVIACNTASSVALATVEDSFRVPIIGVIEPGVKEALRRTKSNRVGVIGTRTTVKSNTYARLLKEMRPGVTVAAQSCPLFVPLVEEGWLRHPLTRAIAAEYLSPLKSANVDTLILGCTHYPLLRPVIQQVMGPRVCLIDSARQVAQQTKELLQHHGMSAASLPRNASAVRFFVSDEPDNFAAVGRRFLGFPLNNVRKTTYV